MSAASIESIKKILQEIDQVFSESQFNRNQYQYIKEILSNIQEMLLQLTPEKQQAFQSQQQQQIQNTESSLHSLSGQIEKLCQSPKNEQIQSQTLNNYTEAFTNAFDFSQEIFRNVKLLFDQVFGSNQSQQYELRNEALKSRTQQLKNEVQNLQNQIMQKTQRINQALQDKSTQQEELQRLTFELQNLCKSKENEYEQLIKDRLDEIQISAYQQQKHNIEQLNSKLEQHEIQQNLKQWVQDEICYQFLTKYNNLTKRFIVNFQEFTEAFLDFYIEQQNSQIKNCKKGMEQVLKENILVAKGIEHTNLEEINSFFTNLWNKIEERVRLINTALKYQQRLNSNNSIEGFLTLEIASVMDKEDLKPNQIHLPGQQWKISEKGLIGSFKQNGKANIGRETLIAQKSNDVNFSHQDLVISRKQCQIYYIKQEKSWFLFDRGSIYGTSLKIQQNPVVLQEGLVIDIANQYRIHFEKVIQSNTIDAQKLVYPTGFVKIFNTYRVVQNYINKYGYINPKNLKPLQHGQYYKGKFNDITSKSLITTSSANKYNKPAVQVPKQDVGTNQCGDISEQIQKDIYKQIKIDQQANASENYEQNLLNQKLENLQLANIKINTNLEKFEQDLKSLEQDVIKSDTKAMLLAKVYYQNPSEENFEEEIEIEHLNTNLEKKYIIGRASNSNKVLRGNRISTLHARIVYDPIFGWLFYDGKEDGTLSTNGSYVNLSDQITLGVRGKSLSYRIKDEDIIHIKGYWIKVKIS